MQNSNKVQVSKISISNILGIEQMELSPGKVTTIKGRNGTGKTSIHEAILSGFAGGKDATLKRSGSQSSEVVIEFSNGSTIKRRISDKTDTVSMFDENGKKVPSPKKHIAELIDIISVNPLEFMTASGKKRAEILLSTIPMKADHELLKRAVEGLDMTVDLNTDGHALEVLERVRKEIYSERTQINRLAKEKDASVSQLKESMVEMDADPAEIGGQIKKLEESRMSIHSELRGKEKNIRDKKQTALDDLEAQYMKRKEEIYRQERDLMSELQQEEKERISPIDERLIRLREQDKHVESYRKQQQIINQYSKESESLNIEADKLTTAINNINELKKQATAELPIRGLEIIDGEIYMNGIVFDRLNTAAKWALAIRIASKRAGDLGLVCVDGLEKFDSRSFEGFVQAAKQSDLQFIVTRVEDCDLEIVTN